MVVILDKELQAEIDDAIEQRARAEANAITDAERLSEDERQEEFCN